MKVSLEFNLPEEMAEFQYALRGHDWEHIVSQMIEWLKRKAEASPHRSRQDAFKEARDHLWDLQSDLGLSCWVRGGEIYPPGRENKEGGRKG